MSDFELPPFAEALLAQVDASRERRGDNKAPYRDFRVRVPLDTANLVHRFASDRRMSVTGAARRSLLAFVAFDYGLDLRELLRNEPASRMQSEGPQVQHYERGEGHGNWSILGLK